MKNIFEALPETSVHSTSCVALHRGALSPLISDGVGGQGWNGVSIHLCAQLSSGDWEACRDSVSSPLAWEQCCRMPSWPFWSCGRRLEGIGSHMFAQHPVFEVLHIWGFFKCMLLYGHCIISGAICTFQELNSHLRVHKHSILFADTSQIGKKLPNICNTEGTQLISWQQNTET